MVVEKMGTVMRWCVQDEVNQEESEQDEFIMYYLQMKDPWGGA